MADPSKTTSAVRKLQLSQLSPTALQQEMMGTDVDVESFVLYLSSVLRTNLVNRIADATITRSIETASSLVVTVNDYERDLLTSGLLSSGVDVEIDGLWFRLAGVDKTGDQLSLTFEDREIAVLREYTSWKIANRDTTTRAEFILNLIREVKEFFIPVVIPELHTVQAVERFSGDLIGVDMVYNKWKGINTHNNAQLAAAAHVPNLGTALKNLFKDAPTFINSPMNPPAASKSKTNKIPGIIYIKTEPAKEYQLVNANQIIQTGQTFTPPVGRKLIVCALMTAIQENTMAVGPEPSNPADSAGIFQQEGSWGSLPDRMNVETAARLFYQRALQKNALNPNESYGQLCIDVQAPLNPSPQPYQQWYNQAEILMNHAGDLPGSAAGANNSGTGATTTSGAYYYYRGVIEGAKTGYQRLPENSWDCILRLAGEVQWRAFFVSGVFYYISEDELYTQKPAFTITEWTEGIIGIDGQYDRNKLYGQLTVTARVGRWLVPPGSVVFVQNMGPWDGRWLVHEYQRDLYNLTATITLGKPLPALPEPVTGDAADLGKWAPGGTQYGYPTTAGGNIPSAPGQFKYPVQKMIVDFAEKSIGLPYVWGAENPGVSFDCSGLAQAAYKAANVPIPRTTFTQWGDSQNKIAHPKDLMPGDLVFFNGGDGTVSNPGHVGIFIGFSGGQYQMINAPYPGVDVQISNFSIPGGGTGIYVGATRDWWPYHGS